MISADGDALELVEQGLPRPGVAAQPERDRRRAPVRGRAGEEARVKTVGGNVRAGREREGRPAHRGVLVVEERIDERGGQGEPGGYGGLQGGRQERGRQALPQHDPLERRARIRAAEPGEGVDNRELLAERLLDAESGEAPPERFERRNRRPKGAGEDLRADRLDIRRSRVRDELEQIVIREGVHRGGGGGGRAGGGGGRGRRLRELVMLHPAAFGEQVQLPLRSLLVHTRDARLRQAGAGLRSLHRRAPARLTGADIECVLGSRRAGGVRLDLAENRGPRQHRAA